MNLMSALSDETDPKMEGSILTAQLVTVADLPSPAYGGLAMIPFVYIVYVNLAGLNSALSVETVCRLAFPVPYAGFWP